MADTFTVVAQYAGLDTLGGTQTQEVTFVGITTKPHGTYVEFPVAQSVYSKEIVNAAAIGWASIAEDLWATPNVVGVQQTQVVNPSNQLVYSWIISVQSDTGDSWSTITIANNDLGPQLGHDRIEALNAQLTATENL